MKIAQISQKVVMKNAEILKKVDIYGIIFIGDR